jgi:hypothetical protein
MDWWTSAISSLYTRRERQPVSAPSAERSTRSSTASQVQSSQGNRTFLSGQSDLGAPLDGNLPSEQEKVVTTKRAPAGLNDPAESCLNRISNANASKVDGSATWAACGNQPYSDWHHGLNISFRRTARRRASIISEWRRGVVRVRVVTSGRGGAARISCRPNLLWCSQVRLRQPDLLLLAQNLALMSL